MRKIILAALLALSFLFVLWLYSKRPLKDYSDPGGPFYKGDYAGAPGQFDGALRVVAWNMHYGEKLDQEMQVLENTSELQNADLLLLQEMDAEGVETLARRLGYNYVFYPAAIHRQRREEYGNAVLSKWPLEAPAKVVLPNWLPGWLQSRNAARATISVGDRVILVYSVHLDTVWMLPFWAETQGEFLVEEAAKRGETVIVGGDFNTWTPGSIVSLEAGMGNIGLERLTRGTGYTFVWSGLRLTLDHIFSPGRFTARAGVYRQTDASDHYPLWAEISIGE